METANAYLPTFIAKYNQRFATAAHNSDDAHRPVLHRRRVRFNCSLTPYSQAFKESNVPI